MSLDQLVVGMIRDACGSGHGFEISMFSTGPAAI